jgi:peptide/nickel transport system substrate-binding protein
MSDLNQINTVNMLSLGILPSFGSALWIRPFVYLPANDSYSPELVTSYQTFPDNNTYIVHLRHDTGWSDGKPVTAWDFYASAIVLAGVGSPAYKYKVIDNYTVSIQVPVLPAVGLYGLSLSSLIFGPDLGATPLWVQYDQWKPVVNDILGNYTQVLAGNSSVIQALTTEAYSYKTPQELFSGAYYPTAVSGSEMVFSKNPYYWDTKNLAIDKLVFYQFTSANTEFQYLDAGQMSIFFTYGVNGGSSDIPANYKAALPGYMKPVVPAGYAGPGLFFNNASGFVSNLHVRKAIAYALNRTELALAGGSSYSPVKLPIGMPEYMWPSMCPASCQSQMNPYNYSLAAATNEMKSAGYSLQNGAWTSNKNGTKVVLTLVNSASTDPTWLSIALDLQTQLQTFGITVNLLNPANPGSYFVSGSGYDMMLTNWGFWITPWDVYANLSYYNGVPYPILHFLGNVTIPINNIGSTNAVTLADDIRNGAVTLAKEAYYAQGLSYLVDQYLPYLPLDGQNPSMYVNTAQFNWPQPTDNSWSGVMAGDIAASFTFQQEHGLISVASGTSSTTSTTTAATTSTIIPTTTSVATATSTATRTSVQTSTTVTTSVQTSTVAAAPMDYTTLIGAAVIAIVLVLVGVMLVRRRPPPQAQPQRAP